jgi:TniQ
MADIKHSEVGAIGMRLDRLAAIARCGVTDLSQIAFALSVNGRRSSQLLGHRLVPRELNLAKPKLCPQCVAEKGFIEAHWHLELMVACPIHRCLATSQCPKCGDRLHWFRPGLLEFDCGGNLRDSDMPEVSSSEAALLDVIRRKLLGYPSAEDNPLSLPQEQLMTMDLRSMLAVVRAIAKHRLVADRYTADPDSQQNILAASRVLMDWPKNFFVLLKDIGQEASTGEYGRVGKHYLSIYRALFRNRAIGSTQCSFPHDLRCR